MPDRPTTPGSDDPAADDPLAGLRKLAGLAKELGVTDVGAFTEALDAARNEGRGPDLFRSLKTLVDQFSSQGDSARSLSELGARLKSLVLNPEATADTVADRRQRVEMALLARIEDLSATAGVDEVAALAGAYARIRAAAAVDDAHDERAAGAARRTTTH